MKKILYVIVPLLILATMESVSWQVYESFKGEDKPEIVFEQEQDHRAGLAPVAIGTPEQQPKTNQEESMPEVTEKKVIPHVASLPELPPKGMGPGSESFPPPSTEVVNGRTERTIHMGVRQYVWEPSVITAKKGELVRLIIHNADELSHGLVIPDLGVNQDIPEDGAVVEFVASQAGTFEFFCSVWCGEGHMEMRGRLRVE